MHALFIYSNTNYSEVYEILFQFCITPQFDRQQFINKIFRDSRRPRSEVLLNNKERREEEKEKHSFMRRGQTPQVDK